MADYAASPAETDTDDGKLARLWIDELDQAEKDDARQAWLSRAKEIINLYAEAKTKTTQSKKRFALFWSNIEVLKPAVLARVPTAVVTRRFKDQDPVGRVASEVLERALNFSIDAYDFDAVLKGCRDEYLLLARGVAWVRYIPHIKTKDGEAKSDEITDDGEPMRWSTGRRRRPTTSTTRTSTTTRPGNGARCAGSPAAPS
jgi:hypothetical protein